ncbi:YqzG/YhdC family protein [Bacillus inaquosorum]|uniref:YqzG/YhdC family protein n=1 Tax=Bacillus inaquosorum TaxID=483913 RepID=UPI00227E1CC8|nr:YqzG/YhdC family protein [Bacillus inaquosorum]MCY7908424.1 YqzG/YhdC family protein [Bacillus inaquosorum]MCY8860231.1 YqzG/YhdC family protein [Bacillus inaquosorum]MCY8869169.1 YqzG/YhdC family protein [Bacillus inaquosorum]MCY8875967.1 YqzG/YhdC family protein [Bacillus inaquosorum]MCY9007895.1 YqzG/YhdC family protein [Bacillus inaquosorum]
MKSLPYTIALLLCGLIIVSMAAKGHSTDTNESVQKWEKLAWSKIQDEYKGASFSDYAYMGRTEVNDEQTKDVFRVTVKQNDDTFSVRAEVYFHPLTKHMISINVFRL